MKNGKDTSFYQYRTDGSLESHRPYTLKDSTTIYTRYYQNKIKLWTREMKNGKANGTTIFFNMKGKRMASLEFRNDTLVDTNFISKKYHFIYGRATYYSVVYGGMPNEDGTSNVSGGHGVFMNSSINAIKLDSTKKEQDIYLSFSTGFNGYYMVPVEKGDFGIFPFHYDVKTINPK